MHIEEIMTKNPVTCNADTELQEVASKMADHDIGAMPVVKNNRPVGIITDRDITCRIVARGQNPLEKVARDAMTSEVVTAAPTDSVEEVERRMTNEKVRRIVIIGNDDEVLGMVAQADLARQVSDDELSDVVEDISEPTAGPSQPGKDT